MRINVEINDLTPDQWTFLQANLHTEYGFEQGEPRMCVVFLRHPAGTEERHAEMPPWTLARLLRLMAAQRPQETLPKRLSTLPTPDAPTCDHGEAVIREDPSTFEGADPIRTYADGCQSYGPYITREA